MPGCKTCLKVILQEDCDGSLNSHSSCVHILGTRCKFLSDAPFLDLVSARLANWACASGWRCLMNFDLHSWSFSFWVIVVTLLQHVLVHCEVEMHILCTRGFYKSWKSTPKHVTDFACMYHSFYRLQTAPSSHCIMMPGVSFTSFLREVFLSWLSALRTRDEMDSENDCHNTAMGTLQTNVRTLGAENVHKSICVVANCKHWSSHINRLSMQCLHTL